MALEIERKFLVDPNNVYNNKNDIHNIDIIKQAYIIKSDSGVLRVRSIISHNSDLEILSHVGYITVKNKSELINTNNEYEMEIPYDIAEDFINKSNNIITKTRYVIDNKDSNIIQLDIFDGKLEGLVLVEVEFATIEDSEYFEPLEWFGKEVTNDKYYSNANLSTLDNY